MSDMKYKSPSGAPGLQQLSIAAGSLDPPPCSSAHRPQRDPATGILAILFHGCFWGGDIFMGLSWGRRVDVRMFMGLSWECYLDVGISWGSCGDVVGRMV